ncbi:MAG TPA: 3D domain-containing protein [Caulobacteraceae bacterium]
MIAGLAAALALTASPAPAAKTAAPMLPAADPIGELILRARKAADDAVTAVETELKATLYHTGVRGIGQRDSLGCRLQPMRTVAVDPRVFPRHSVLFIKETVGLKMPDGSSHDGYWYASDVGGAIKGARIDLFTGAGAASMKVLQALNLTTITAVKVGVFEGCPTTQSPTMMAQNTTAAER